MTGNEHSHAYDITDFQRDVIERSASIPVLVDFWAEWCGPCRILGPTLERLAEKHAGEWELKKVNTEVFPDIARTYGIRSIPNVKLFVNRAPVNEFVGALPENAIEQWLSTALPDPHESDIASAETLVREGRIDEAGATLDDILAADPAHERARILRAMTFFFSDRGRAMQLVDGLEPGGQQGERIEAMRTLNALFMRRDSGLLQDGSSRDAFDAAVQATQRQDFPAALEGFIGIIRTERYYDNDAARKACIAIFKFLGEDHAVTLAHRREFDRSLY